MEQQRYIDVINMYSMELAQKTHENINLKVEVESLRKELEEAKNANRDKETKS